MAMILVIAEHHGGRLNPVVANTVDAAMRIGSSVHVAVFSGDADSVAREAGRLQGVEKVLTIERPENATPLAAVLAPQVIELAGRGYTHLLAPSTTFGKDLMPRVAGLMGVQAVTDINAVHDACTFDRPIYAGNVVVTIEVPAEPAIVGTVRTTAFKAVPGGGEAPVEAARVDVALPGHTRFKNLQVQEGGRPDLQSAPRVICGGRGLGTREGFEMVHQLAETLGAAVGASRAAVDLGFCPNDLQVGQTGKIIAPELCITVGISGAIQFLAGIKDAGTIVAINRDHAAPVFEVADIGLVGDLFEILPELERRL
jgi:electron transfer flavoprotein alpha subunit